MVCDFVQLPVDNASWGDSATMDVFDIKLIYFVLNLDLNWFLSLLIKILHCYVDNVFLIIGLKMSVFPTKFI